MEGERVGSRGLVPYNFRTPVAAVRKKRSTASTATFGPSEEGGILAVVDLDVVRAGGCLTTITIVVKAESSAFAFSVARIKADIGSKVTFVDIIH